MGNSHIWECGKGKLNYDYGTGDGSSMVFASIVHGSKVLGLCMCHGNMNLCCWLCVFVVNAVVGYRIVGHGQTSVHFGLVWGVLLNLFNSTSRRCNIPHFLLLGGKHNYHDISPPISVRSAL